MGSIADTYDFARSIRVEELARSVRTNLSRAVCVVGSGGSYTAAAFLRKLHMEATGLPSTAMTPLELESIGVLSPDAAIWLVSARGRNVDILEAAKSSARLEPASIVGLIAAENTPLGAFLDGHSVGAAHGFVPPSGRDGYLATNTLLATMIVLYRAYKKAQDLSDDLPSFAELTGIRGSVARHIERLDKALVRVWARGTVLLLHGAATAAAAIDIESKMTEAALAVVKPSDFRSFAHGRHHWLTRFANDTAVIVLEDPASSAISQRTVSLFPRTIETHIIDINRTDALAEISGMIHGFLLTASLGHQRTVDPGRPGVAEFGSRIYHLARARRTRKQPARAAARRKFIAGAAPSIEAALALAESWIDTARSAKIAGAVFDLDGTLIDVKSRFDDHCHPDLREALNRLAWSGLLIGIATGRGPGKKTIALLQALVDRDLWQHVVVGFYNGSLVKTLDGLILSDEKQQTLTVVNEALKDFAEPYKDEIEVDASDYQITLKARHSDIVARPERLFLIAQQAIVCAGVDAKVLRSSHSVDVVERRSTKSHVIDHLTRGEDLQFLRFGDMGDWPGNDHELLANRLGLSVGRVSSDPIRCWNVLPAGIRGVAGTIQYLRALRLVDGDFRLGLKT